MDYKFFVICMLIGVKLCMVFILFMKRWIKTTNLRSVKYNENINDAIGDKSVHNFKFKILTYNCYLRSCGVISSCIFDYKNERLDEIINVIGEYDIVCLQEVFASLSFRTEHLINAAREFGFDYCVVPEQFELYSRKLIDSGLVILSKYPILDYKCISFEHGGVYSDQLADKGFQHAKILINGRIIHVINTHVQSDYAIYDNLASNVKIAQYKQIHNYIELVQTDNIDDVYLCGDLNCNAIYINEYLRPTGWISRLYDHLIYLFDLRYNNSDLLYDRTYLDEKNIYWRGMRPATTYSTYDMKGREIDTVLRDNDDPYLTTNKYVCLPRSVDYIILIRNKNANISYVKCLKCKTKNFESHHTNAKNNRIKFLSDHSAVYATMKFINPSNYKATNNYIKSNIN